MSVKNKTNKNYKRSQKGRSMVEMLGVLAIVGVLSVGGLYGYGVAMKKHKANELLHQASMLATTISAQAMTNDGKLPETITSFGNSSYGNFSTSVSDALNGKGFSITIENVDSAVCDQLKAGGMVQGVECVDSTTSGKKDAKITYYKNLATNEIEGKKSPTGEEPAECSGHGSKDSNDDCVCDPGYSGTGCATAVCTTGTYCGDDSGTAICCATDEVCTTSGDVAGTCVKNSSGCTTNASCDDATKYCKVENTKYECEAPDKGTCTTLDAGRETTYENGTNKKTFLVSSGYMSWWAADNWCKAHDMKLVSYNTAHNLFDCDKDNYSCTWSKFTTSSYWDNGTLPDYYWTAESYDSCSAWAVGVSNAFFDSASRAYDNVALCE